MQPPAAVTRTRRGCRVLPSLLTQRAWTWPVERPAESSCREPAWKSKPSWYLVATTVIVPAPGHLRIGHEGMTDENHRTVERVDGPLSSPPRHRLVTASDSST